MTWAPRRSPRTSEFVYFVQAETMRLVKIGVAIEPADRLCTLRCGSPDELTLLGVMRSTNPGGLERTLHRTFAAHRSHGEWFRPAPELLAYIAANAVCYDALLSAENRDRAAAVLRCSPSVPRHAPQLSMIVSTGRDLCGS